MLKIYELIKQAESEIGNGARVHFYMTDNMLTVRVDWPDDYRAMKYFSEVALADAIDDGMLLRLFIRDCKIEYARNKSIELAHELAKRVSNVQPERK